MALRHSHQRGDVASVLFPFSDASGDKDRPAVVLSTTAYHDEWDELLVVAITSVPPKKTRTTDYLLQDWQLAGLRQPSWVRSRVATVHRKLIYNRLGQPPFSRWAGGG